MNYLVTGAAGFIGSCIVKELMSKGNTCVTIDNLSTGKVENIPLGCKFIEGNTYDPEIIARLENEQFDAIIHIAGQSSGEVSYDDPVYDLNTNTKSTIMLLKYAQRHNISKFIYASSMSVYGDHIPPICSEETPTVPKSFYAVGKLASENYLRLFSSSDMACTALRFFNIYGVGQNMDNLRQGMISIYLAMAIKDKKICVKGSKERFRDFVYIDDLVDAVIRCLSIPSGFNVYNVCTGVPTTVERVITTICDSLPYEVSIEYEGGTPGDQFGIYGDPNKIMKELDWKTNYDFNSGMKKFIDWARKELE